MNTEMSLAGIKTVGSLIRQASKASGIDIYADPRYAGYRVTLIGGPTANVRSLLRALAFCCTAVYRRVGPASDPHPAYVLTHDLVGMGTRKSLWYEFEQDGDALRVGPVFRAAQSLYTRFGPQSVSSFGDAAALKPATAQPSPGEDAADPDAVALQSIDTSYSKLTPAQQSAVARVIEQHNKTYTSQPGVAGGRIKMNPEVKLELLVPSLEAPLDRNLAVPKILMFRMPKDVADRVQASRVKNQIAAYQAAHPGAKTTYVPPAPSATAFAEMLAKNPRRAVILSPKTLAEVADDIAAMQKLSLNELWLDLPYRRGTSKTESKAGANEAPKPAEVPTPDELLTAALHGTKKTGIRVYPMIDVFAEARAIGGKPTTSAAVDADEKRDRNILGETSLEAETHVNDRLVLAALDTSLVRFPNEEIRPLPPVELNPLANGVLADAQTLIRYLGAQTGVAGFIWKNTDPAGYDAIRGGEDLNRRLLGYSDAMRLAFLRQSSADPVDLYTPNYYTGKANTDVAAEAWTNTTGEFNQKWKAFRRAQNVDFLRQLSTAAGSLPIVMHQRREGSQVGFTNGLGHLPGWFGSWDGGDAPLPTFRSQGDDQDLAQGAPNAQESRLAEPDVQARKQSQSVLNVISVSSYQYICKYSLIQPVGAARPAARTNDGFVLDFAQPNHGFSSGSPADIPQSLVALAAARP